MDARLKAAARWAFALLTLCMTTFVLFILLMGIMTWPDRSIVTAFSVIGIAPRATIEAAHRFDFFLAILIWIVPSVSAIGFAASRSQRGAIRLALSISVLIFAIVCFLLDRHDHSVLLESVSAGAAVISLSALFFSNFRPSFARLSAFANIIAVALLFVPTLWALSHITDTAPQPKQLWSTTLQQSKWQSMNTGSEYAATRQVTFVGDRVAAVFDSGFAPSQPSKDKWPLSNYRLVSLDLLTGAKRNEITFTGRWGAMPYIYSNQGTLIAVQSSPPRTLNPDLSPARDPIVATSAAATINPTCGTNCDRPTYALSKDTFVRLQPKQFEVLDKAGNIINRGSLVEWGVFAGVSADGRRFAIQSSYTEGDPNFVVYEYFTIYDVATGKIRAIIHIQDLPARQSWSAFSPDGRYFAAGNPNRLTMYELP